MESKPFITKRARFSLNRVIRLQGDGNYTRIFYSGIARSVGIVAITINTVQQRVGSDFLRVHRGCLINRKYIASFIDKGRNGGIVILSDGEHCKVSRRRKETIEEIKKIVH